jgi:uncharacterized membrane protein YidH (DUF202 family)
VRSHAFDPASFVLGLVLTGVALAYLVAEAQNRSVDGAWVLPLTLIGLGVAAVAAGLNRALRKDQQTAMGRQEPQDEPAEPAVTD